MILVTGASGFVGRHLLNSFNNLSPVESEYLIPVYRTNPVPGGVQLNLADAVEVAAFFAGNDVTAVVHLAAEARPHICETDYDAAYRGNVLTTKNLLDACSSSRPYFLYISTDMVFGGTRSLYREDDTPDPLNAYGRSKVEAERAVQAYSGDWCVLRPALIYGAPVAGKQSFLSWMVNALRTGEGRFFEDEIRSPVWVKDLVLLIEALVSSEVTGIVHSGGLECFSRADLARMSADVWGLTSQAVATTNLSADVANDWRPRNVCLHSPTAHSLVQFTAVRDALMLIRNSGLL